MIRDAEPTRSHIFLAMLKQAGLPHPHQEYRFDTTRRWRFDYAWPQYSVALEQQGGIWTRGRHSRGTGQLRDMEKFSEAGAQGWIILYATPSDLCSEQTLDWIRRAMHSERGTP